MARRHVRVVRLCSSRLFIIPWNDRSKGGRGGGVRGLERLDLERLSWQPHDDALDYYTPRVLKIGQHVKKISKKMIYPSFDQKFRVASPEGDCFNEKIEFEENKCFRHFAKIVARQQSRPVMQVRFGQ